MFLAKWVGSCHRVTQVWNFIIVSLVQVALTVPDSNLDGELVVLDVTDATQLGPSNVKLRPGDRIVQVEEVQQKLDSLTTCNSFISVLQKNMSWHFGPCLLHMWKKDNRLSTTWRILKICRILSQINSWRKKVWHGLTGFFIWLSILSWNFRITPKHLSFFFLFGWCCGAGDRFERYDSWPNSSSWGCTSKFGKWSMH